MGKLALSPTRITTIALVLGGALAVVALSGPVKYHVGLWTEPVVVRPAITGVVYFYGVPASGVEVRAAQVGNNNWPSCGTLPVVAVSNNAGEFSAPALRKPSFLVNNSKRIPVEVCLSRGKVQLQSWVSFLLPNELLVHKLKCKYPVPEPWRPEDVPCHTP